MRLSSITGSIRRTLIALVFVSILPALGIILYSAVMDRKHAHEEARLSASRLATAMAEVQDRNTGTIRQLLDLLGNTSLLQSGGPEDISRLLRRLAVENPMLADIYVAGLDGSFKAAAAAVPGTNILDRPYFRKALSQGAFTAGSFQLDRSSHEPVFPFAAPLHDASGEVRGVIAASISLAGYSSLFDKSSLPPDSVFSLTDRDGIRLCRFPLEDSAKPGQPMPEELWTLMSAKDPPDTAVLTGADGTRRIYAFTRLRLSPQSPPYMHVVVGIPEQEALAAANDALGRNLMLLALATVMALAISWTLWKPVAGRRIDRLVAVTRRLGRGDLSARVDGHSPSGELGTLEVSVNAMAQALSDSARKQSLYELALKKAHDELEQRVQERTRELQESNRKLTREMFERERAEAALRASETMYRSLYEQAAAGILILSPEGRILDANPAALSLLDSTQEEIKSLTYQDLIPQDTLGELPLQLDAIASGMTLQAERFFKARGGALVPVDVACSRINEAMLQVVFTDATQRKKFEQLREDVERILRHDLKAPLMGLVQMPSLLLRGEGLTEKQRTYIQMMRDSANRMLHAINMSMTIYKMETGRYDCDSRCFDLLATLGRITGEAAFLSGSRKTAATVRIDGRPPSQGDSFMLLGEEPLCVTMLENLVKNAIEASPDGGEIFLELDSRSRTLSIRNKGEVPQEIRGRFFEKYATSGKKWGTGLGTYSAKLVASAHGWDIRLDSSVPGETGIVLIFTGDGSEQGCGIEEHT